MVYREKHTNEIVTITSTIAVVGIQMYYFQSSGSNKTLILPVDMFNKIYEPCKFSIGDNITIDGESYQTIESIIDGAYIVSSGANRSTVAFENEPEWELYQSKVDMDKFTADLFSTVKTIMKENEEFEKKYNTEDTTTTVTLEEWLVYDLRYNDYNTIKGTAEYIAEMKASPYSNCRLIKLIGVQVITIDEKC